MDDFLHSSTCFFLPFSFAPWEVNEFLAKLSFLMNVAAETLVSSTQIVLKRLKKVSFLDKFVKIKNENFLSDFQTL